MIIGSGLLAQAFAPSHRQSLDVCIFAAGVSNSGCTDQSEFERERARLLAALAEWPRVGAFAYFGTCSVGDAEARQTPYVQHKLAMEGLVAQHPNFLILRLPQLAGVTPNPHTLLNYLHARIARSESFSLWRNAFRNILDVADVAKLTDRLIEDGAKRRLTMNLANPTSYPMPDIVAAMERVVGKPAVYDVLERGRHYPIDVGPMLRLLGNEDLGLGDGYLQRILTKYYERA